MGKDQSWGVGSPLPRVACYSCGQEILRPGKFWNIALRGPRAGCSLHWLCCLHIKFQAIQGYVVRPCLQREEGGGNPHVQRLGTPGTNLNNGLGERPQPRRQDSRFTPQ